MVDSASDIFSIVSFVSVTMATSVWVQLSTEKECNRATLMAFYTNFATEFFHTVFTRRSVLKGTLRRDQKVIFVKSPISSPIVMP